MYVYFSGAPARTQKANLNMKYTPSLCFLLLLTLYACKKPVTYCGVEDPISDIDWIKDEIKNSSPKLRIYKQTYNSTEGFYVYDCFDTACYGISTYYKTCDNTLLYKYVSGPLPSTFPNDFNLNSTYRELIYPQ
jgi:hypothetical protein